MSDQKEIKKEYRERQEKYVYYVIALCVTAIGFSVFNTMNKRLTWSQAPLGVAIISWSISIIYGFGFLEYQLGALHINSLWFDVVEGRDREIGTSLEQIAYASQGIEEKIGTLSKKTSRLLRRQLFLFYAGMLSFIVWRILEMRLVN